MKKPSQDTLLLAYQALAALVRAEYPDRPLPEIAEIWGGVTAEEVAALEEVEAYRDLNNSLTSSGDVPIRMSSYYSGVLWNS